MKKIYILFVFSLCAMAVFAQDGDLSTSYRSRALEYNQDVKAAKKNVLISKELEKSAKADYKPKLSAGANFNYTGNPMQLDLNIPSISQPIGFQGKNLNYGASVTLTQPVYTGGRIREMVRLAQKEGNVARNQYRLVMTDISYEADARYWTAVASREVAGIMSLTRQSVKELVDVVEERVEAGLVPNNDLLMAEVKLNETDYQLLQAQNNSELARLSLNSFIGADFENNIQIDPAVPAATDMQVCEDMNRLPVNRPELHIALDRIDIQESMKKIENSRFLPQFYVGADGSYSSPGYNFKADMDPNYAVYAKVTVPLFEWGKRKNEKNASNYRIGMAQDNYRKIADQVNLEIKSAYYTCQEATRQVVLTQNSLAKAAENEKMARERYTEGLVSITEVLDAQFFHQTAQINYVQSRMNAQLSLSNYNRVLGAYQY